MEYLFSVDEDVVFVAHFFDAFFRLERHKPEACEMLLVSPIKQHENKEVEILLKRTTGSVALLIVHDGGILNLN